MFGIPTSDVVLPELSCAKVVLANEPIDRAGEQRVVRQHDRGDRVLGFRQRLDRSPHLRPEGGKATWKQVRQLGSAEPGGSKRATDFMSQIIKDES